MTEDKNIKHEIIDNFLPQKEFKEIQEILLETNPNSQHHVTWSYVPYPVVLPPSSEEEEVRQKGMVDWYLIHTVYASEQFTSNFIQYLSPISPLLGIKALMRIKINMYPNTETFKEHEMHTDLPFSHKAAILSVNTCDGYTKLEDGTKIDSVENRMLLFDASTLHSSTTCTDQPVRVNINFNYF